MNDWIGSGSTTVDGSIGSRSSKGCDWIGSGYGIKFSCCLWQGSDAHYEDV